MTRSFKVPVNAPEISTDGTISATALGGALLSSVTPGQLAAASSSGTSSIPSREDHLHETVVVYSGSTPSNTNVIWVDTASSSGSASIGVNLFDAKGDLIVGSADNTPAKLIVGTNDYVLTADSTATYGIAWKASSGLTTGKSIALSIVLGG